MSEDLINYGKLIDDAMHIIVKKALQIVMKQEGLPGAHHFFISFLTRHPGVVLSERLRQKYPNEMTVVLQYQFEDLEVGEDIFSVTLSFDNIKERVTIPLEALTAFADPSVKFGLQFRFMEEESSSTDSSASIPTEGEATSEILQEPKPNPDKPSGGNNVITLDSFRKK